MSLILLILVHFIGVEIKGAKRWLDLIIFRLQPIELIKPFFVLITANIIASGKDKNLKYKYFQFNAFICHNNLTFKSAGCWSINFINNNLGIYSVYIWN